MSQERWDVVLQVLEGPLSYQGDLVCRGPVVRMGANPGPGGVKLEGYRGLDARQAVITAYDGGTVSIAPVGKNQVRVAPHENVDWKTILEITGPVYLSPGAAFHLGPPGRGVTAVFVESRRLGTWQGGRIVSDAAQAAPDAQSSNVKELQTGGGIPVWFIPAMLGVGLMTAVAVLIPIIGLYARDIEELGPVEDGEELYEFIEASVAVDPSLREGLNQPFHDFVMKPNADRSEWRQLENPNNWDQTFLDFVTRSALVHAKAWYFWQRLEAIEADYAYVVKELRDRGMPEIFAAIPYQESGYRSNRQSPVCAQGYWQILPEVANRVNLRVRNCKMRGTDRLYTPEGVVPVRGVIKNAPYVDSEGPSCRIQSCEEDERTRLPESTRGALELLGEAWNDPVIRGSGAAIQLTILSHNSGLDNAAIDGGKPNPYNVKVAYKRYLKATNETEAPDFYGRNITCTGPEDRGIANINNRCGGSLASETQHYAYNIVAQHFLAVCYYAQNYGSKEPFNTWRNYTRGDGYCTNLQVPTLEEVSKRGR